MPSRSSPRPAPPRGGVARLLTRPPGWPVLAVIVVVSCVFCFVAVWPSDYAQDDLLYFVLERGTPFRDWLASVYFQHWAPGYRLTFSLLDQIGVRHYWIVLTGQIALLALMLVLFDAVLRILAGGRRWWTAALVALVGTSIYLPRFVTWPAAGLQLMPSYVALIGGLWAYLRFREDGRLRWCDLTAALMAFGLCFYERPLLLPVYVLLLRVLVLERTLSPRRQLRGLWAERRWWIAAVLPAVVYLAFRWLTDVGNGGPTGLPTSTALSQFARIVYLRGFFPGFLGVRVPGTDPGRLADVSVVVAQVALIAFVLWTLVRQPAAVRAWLFFAVAGIVSVTLAAYARLKPLGSGIGFDPRYLADLLFLFPIAITAAVSEPRRRVGARWGARRATLGAGVAAALMVAHVILALDQAQEYQRTWNGTAAHAYFNGVDRSLARLGPHPALADGFVPPAVQTQDAYGRISAVVGLRAPDVRWDIAPPDLQALDDDGVARPVALRPLRSIGARDLQPAGSYERRGDAICEVGSGDQLLLQVALRRPITGTAALYLRVTSAGSAPPVQAVTFAAPAGGTYPGTSDRLVHVGADVPGLVPLETPTLSLARIDLPDASGACVRTVEIGTLQPAGG